MLPFSFVGNRAFVLRNRRFAALRATRRDRLKQAITLGFRALAAGTLLLATLGVGTRARAEEPGSFELRSAERAATERGLALEAQPSGKRIVFVRIVREDVFAEGELLVPVVLPSFASTWPNKFRITTREEVVRRELLFAEGDVYDEARVQESMRNLRSTGLFSLVRVIAVRAERPDEVGLLVYTRDVWSLRLETVFVGTGAAFQVTAQLVERNLLGEGKQLALRFDRDLKAFSVGEVYQDRRVLGEALQLVELFDLIWNRETGKLEGSQGAVRFGRPFYDLEQRTAWELSAGYADFVARRLKGVEIAPVRPDAGGRLLPCVYGEPRCYLQVWDERRVEASATLQLRYGHAYKQTFSFTAGASDRGLEANEEGAVRSTDLAEFEREVLPKARRQIYPGFGYSLWLPEFVVLENLTTFGQSESIRTGPILAAGMSFPLEAFGSSTSSAAFSSSLGYVWSKHDALAEIELSAGTRLEEGEVVDQRAGAVARGASPPLGVGRVVLYASYSGRKRDTARTFVTLGGSNGLRGYDADVFGMNGASRAVANLEYRTLPLELGSIHVGAVAFYDAGALYASLSEVEAHHAVGVGLRALLPQLNRSPFRLDVGVPLDERGFAVALSYGSDQAVRLTALEDQAEEASVRPR